MGPTMAVADVSGPYVYYDRFPAIRGPASRIFIARGKVILFGSDHLSPHRPRLLARRS
jgi:hypothetical protein